MDIFTQYEFVNKGTMPATYVKIKLTYPAGTQIKKIVPPFRYKELEDDDSKVVELYVQRMEVNIPLAVSLLTEHAHIEPPKVSCNEDEECIEVKEGG